MPTIKHYKTLLADDSAVVFFIGGLLTCIVGFLLHAPLICTFGFVFAYTGFDVLGYKWVLYHRYGIASLLEHVSVEIRDAYLSEQFEVSKAAYRVVQHSITIFVSILALPLIGWLPVITFWIIWISGTCDILYYWCIENELPESWSWVGWVLPLGLIFKIFGKDIPNGWMIANATLGFIIAIVIQFL
jgi:hypothetical protein